MQEFHISFIKTLHVVFILTVSMTISIIFKMPRDEEAKTADTSYCLLGLPYMSCIGINKQKHAN